MAFITGGLTAGGLFGGLFKAAIGIGLKLVTSFLFPQKIQGPRAESLKAQTSRYGDRIARSYGTTRLAGAVIWLKGDQVDEHVRTERQGKALGPEVTSYSYTATFAVAFAFNGPFAAIPRIWADDKLIYDDSADSLQEAIDTGGDAIGVAEGASVTVYLGTDTQDSDPDIEADRGAGNVPAWPGICYVVIKDLPLDEFGIRVPNIEAEVIHLGTIETPSFDSFSSTSSQFSNDTNGNYIASNDSGDLTIRRMPSGALVRTITGTYGGSVHITNRLDVAVVGGSGTLCGFFDAATGAFTHEVSGLGGINNRAFMDDVSIGATSYLLIGVQTKKWSLLSRSGTTWAKLWTETTTYGAVTQVETMSLGPEYAYAIASASQSIVRFAWTVTGIISETLVTLSEPTDDVMACFYDDESDSVIVLDKDGNLFVYTSDLSSLLRSNLSTGIGALAALEQPLLSKRMKSRSGVIAIKSAPSGNDIREFNVASLSEYSFTDAATTDWVNKVGGILNHTAVNATWRAVMVMNGFGLGGDVSMWFLPRLARAGEPLADVIEAECTLAGLPCDVSAISSIIKGYADRNGTPPRGVIEDLIRVNFVDFAHIDGMTTFFPRKTASARTLTVAQTGLALNSEPDPVQVVEEYPAALDVPEQVIIAYPSWDAIYRTGSQAGNADEDQPFDDEPTIADETGAPLKIRRARPLEFSTSQVLTDSEAVKICDKMWNDLKDAATIYRTSVGPSQLDLYPGFVLTLPLDDTRSSKAVITKMTGETLIDMEFRKRGDTYESDAVPQPTPYVIRTLLGMATATPVLIDGHLMRSDDDDDAFYAGVAVTSSGQFRSATLFQSEDGGSTYQPWAAFSNGTIRGIALDALPDRPHPDAWDRATSFNIAVPQGTAPDSVSEESLLASETSNAFAVWNASVGDWEYIRAATVVDNLDKTWTLSTLLRGRKGTENAMAGHAEGAIVYHLDTEAILRATDADRTLARIYVATPTSTRFSSTGAVTFTNTGKGLRPWAPVLASAVLDSGSGDWTFTWHRRDRLGQEWPEDGPEDPPMSEDTEEYTVKFYSGVTLMGTYTSATESYVYSSADQITDFGSPQTSIEIGIAQVSTIYGDGVELREAA